MQSSNKREILDTATSTDETDWAGHVEGFVSSFVQKDRRERWLYLLLNRSDKIRADSHKLHGHLDLSKCFSIEDSSQLNSKLKGFYYDFSNVPVNLTVAEAFVVGPNEDGLFLIAPGKLAIYFFHEGEIVLCKN